MPDKLAESPCQSIPLEQRIESLLFSSERALSETKLQTVLGIEDATKEIKQAIESLNQSYDEQSRAFRIERIAGGYRVMTREEFSPLVSRLHAERQQQRLSQAALETLSIIAYRQPVMRAEVEVIRGVACGEVLKGLMDRRLIKIVGRAEEVGRPMLYGTTKDFLRIFGLANLQDLPEVQGLSREPSWKPAPQAPSESPEAIETTIEEPSDVAVETATSWGLLRSVSWASMSLLPLSFFLACPPKGRNCTYRADGRKQSALNTAGARCRAAPPLIRNDWARPVKWPFVIFARAARITARSARQAPDLS